MRGMKNAMLCSRYDEHSRCRHTVISVQQSHTHAYKKYHLLANQFSKTKKLPNSRPKSAIETNKMVLKTENSPKGHRQSDMPLQIGPPRHCTPLVASHRTVPFRYPTANGSLPAMPIEEIRDSSPYGRECMWQEEKEMIQKTTPRGRGTTE